MSEVEKYLISGAHDEERRTKLVIVMRKDLNMRKGKMVAQGAHAAMMWLSEAITEADIFDGLQLTGPEREWLTGRFTKICVSVDSEDELIQIHKEALRQNVRSSLCVDAGLTEFGGVPTPTCCAIGPDMNESVDAITGGLKLL